MSEQRPNPGANAARRARRIGGRPTPAPASTPEPAERVGLDKPSPPRPAPPAARTDGVRSLPLAWFPAAVLGTAAVLLLGILVWFSHGGYWSKPPLHQVVTPSSTKQQQVLAAAKKCFVTVNSYDYRKLDDALSAGQKCTTGKFSADYELAFHEQVEKLAPQEKVIRSAQVNTAGIEAISQNGTQWVILVYGQLHIDSASTEKSGSPQISPVGGVVTMDDVDGQWLISKVDVDAGTGLGD